MRPESEWIHALLGLLEPPFPSFSYRLSACRFWLMATLPISLFLWSIPDGKIEENQRKESLRVGPHRNEISHPKEPSSVYQRDPGCLIGEPGQHRFAVLHSSSLPVSIVTP